MSEQKIIEAFLYPGDKERVLSLLPIVKDPAGIRDGNNNRTLLHFAADNDWTDVCQLLVEQYQVDPHCRDIIGWTALHCACIYNHLDVVQYLVCSVCCDPLTENNEGHTPLSYSKAETRLFLQSIIG